METSDVCTDTEKTSYNDRFYRDEMFELRSANSRLTQENSSLIAQLKQTDTLCAQIEEFSRQISSLKEEVYKSQEENFELKQRLEITCENNCELQYTIEKQSKELSKLVISEADIKKEKTELEEKMENLRNEKRVVEEENIKISKVVDSLREELRKNGDENTTDKASEALQAIVKDILACAELYFSRPFKVPSDLLYYFRQMNTQSRSGTSSPTPENEDTVMNERKILLLKEKLKDEKRRKTAMKEELDVLNTSMVNVLAELKKYQSINRQLKRNIDELERNGKNTENVESINTQRILEYEKRISNQNATIKILEEHIKTLEKTMESIGESSQKEYSALLEQSSSIEEDLKCQNLHLLQQIREYEEEMNSLRKVLNEAKKECQDRIRYSDKLAKDLDIEKMHTEGLTEKIGRLSLQLDAAKIAFNQCQAEIKASEGNNEKLKASIDLLQSNMDSQRLEIIHLIMEREKLINALRNQNKALSYYDSMIEKIKNEKEEIRSLDPIVIKEIIPDVISPASWLCSDFPQNLIQKLKDTAQTSKLSLNMQVKQGLSIIGKYYNEEINKNMKKLDESDSTTKRLLEFVENTFNLFNQKMDSSIDFNIIEKEAERLFNIADECSKLEKELLQHKQILKWVCEECDVGVIQEIPPLVKNLCKIAKERDELSTITREMKIKSKKNQKIHKKEMAQLGNDLSKKQADIDTLTDMIEKNKETVEKLKKEINELREEKEKEKTEYDAKLHEMCLKHDDEVNILKAEFSSLNKLSITQKKTYEDEISRYKQHITRLQNQIADQKNNINILISEKADMMKARSSLLLEQEELEAYMKNKGDNEREALADKFQMMIENLRMKNKEQTKLLEKVYIVLEDNESRLKQQIDENTRMSIERSHLLSEIALFKDGIERERKISDSKVRAIHLAADIRIKEALQDYKNEVAQDKAKFLGYIASTFKKYVNIRAKLDEVYIKQLLLSIKATLDKIEDNEQSIRRILGVEDNESVVDAVKCILSSRFSH